MGYMLIGVVGETVDIFNILRTKMAIQDEKSLNVQSRRVHSVTQYPRERIACYII